jgi:hypothetical protein
MKYDKHNSKKSRKLKSKNTKKTRSRPRIHLDKHKHKQKGGGDFLIDVSEDRDNIYITFKRTSGVAYLYKINLKDKTYEIYIPEDGNAIQPRPLNNATSYLRKIISRAIKNTEIYNIFVENDIDPSLPIRKSSLPDSPELPHLPNRISSAKTKLRSAIELDNEYEDEIEKGSESTTTTTTTKRLGLGNAKTRKLNAAVSFARTKQNTSASTPNTLDAISEENENENE